MNVVLPKVLTEIQSDNKVLLYSCEHCEEPMIVETKYFTDDWLVLKNGQVFSRDTGFQIDPETNQRIGKAHVEVARTAAQLRYIREHNVAEIENIQDEIEDIENTLSGKMVAFLLANDSNYRRIKKHLPKSLLHEILVTDVSLILNQHRNNLDRDQWREGGFEI